MNALFTTNLFTFVIWIMLIWENKLTTFPQEARLGLPTNRKANADYDSLVTKGIAYHVFKGSGFVLMYYTN